MSRLIHCIREDNADCFTLFVHNPSMKQCFVISILYLSIPLLPAPSHSCFLCQQATEPPHSSIHITVYISLCVFHQTYTPLFLAHGHTTDRSRQCSLSDVHVVVRRPRVNGPSVKETVSLMLYLSMVFMSVIQRPSLSMSVPKKTNPKVNHRPMSSMKLAKKAKRTANHKPSSSMRVPKKTNPKANH